jgi:hypothetical protein
MKDQTLSGSKCCKDFSDAKGSIRVVDQPCDKRSRSENKT